MKEYIRALPPITVTLRKVTNVTVVHLQNMQIFATIIQQRIVNDFTMFKALAKVVFSYNERLN